MQNMPAKKKNVKDDESVNDEKVGLSAKTSEANRAWWLYQARLQRTTLQDVIIESLEKRFGLPKKQ